MALVSRVYMRQAAESKIFLRGLYILLYMDSYLSGSSFTLKVIESCQMILGLYVTV